VAQPDFLNAVVEIACILPPEAVLHHLQNVEHILGRNRALEQRWGPRTLDVDYLMDTAYPTFTKPDLELPHPRMWERAFVLCPLAELLPSTFTPQGEPLPLAANRLAKEQHIRKLTKAEGPDLW
jgi:2-amino-4-hydroxy-6-hydroxymethyldihydropteridine diphosphokinase